MVVHNAALLVDEEIRVVDRGCKQGEGKYGSMGKLDVEDSCNRALLLLMVSREGKRMCFSALV